MGLVKQMRMERDWTRLQPQQPQLSKSWFCLWKATQIRHHLWHMLYLAQGMNKILISTMVKTSLMGQLYTVTVQFPSPAPPMAQTQLLLLIWQFVEPGQPSKNCPSKKGKYVFARLLSLMEAMGGWRHTWTHPREWARKVEKEASSNQGWEKRENRASR